MIEYKKCSCCGDIKNIYEFIWKKNDGIKNYCYECKLDKDRIYREDNKEKIKIANKKYESENREKINEKGKIYRDNNKEKIKENRDNNKEEMKIYFKERHKKIKDTEEHKMKRREYYKNNKDIIIKKQIDRYNNDPNYKFRVRVSSSIREFLKGNKWGSAWKALPYSYKELKEYIESLFEDWMTWDNWKPYNSKTWDDNDKLTWTWNLDHIIPQTLLPYDSLDHPNFLKAWALLNLRPYSAKQNIIDGNRRPLEENLEST